MSQSQSDSAKNDSAAIDKIDGRVTSSTSVGDGLQRGQVFPHTSIEVTIRIFNARVSVVDSLGDAVGSWPVERVSVTSLTDGRYHLAINREEALLDIADGGDFGSAMREAAANSTNLSGSNRVRAARIFRGSLESLAPSNRSDTSDREDSKRIDVEEVPAGLMMQDVYTGEFQLQTSHHSKVASAQSDVVNWLREGMMSWFGYFLRLDESEHGKRRRVVAGQGLEMAARRLRGISDDLHYLAEWGTPHDGLLVLEYETALVHWASGLETMARGAAMDSQQFVLDGFDAIAEGTEIASAITESDSKSDRSEALDAALKVLSGVKPPVRVSLIALRRAKRPWRAALLAAGSPIRWLDSAGNPLVK